VAAIVTDVPEQSRFELRDGDELLGWLEYLPAGASVILAHTEVPSEHEGHGYGGQLVVAALEQLDERGKTALPTCPFAAEYIRRHPDLARYVDASLRAQFAGS
jgi:uncharacterized protein